MITKAELKLVEALVEEPEGNVVDTSGGTCSKCGCTDERACIGGCAWVAERLCSSCQDADG